jgi:hypothetical protein
VLAGDAIAVEDVVHTINLCGGYRRDLVVTTSFTLKDSNIDYEHGLASEEVEVCW